MLDLKKSNTSGYIIEHVDLKSNTKKKLVIENLNELKFYLKTNNIYYKKFKKIGPEKVIEEMMSADVGFDSNTTDHGEPTSDTYAPGDSRNLFGSGKSSKKKKKKSKKDKSSPDFPVVRRTFPENITNV